MRNQISNIDNYFELLKERVRNKFNFLEDKPEETIDSTLKALWYAAYGISKSAEEAAELDLPPLTEFQFELLDQLLEKRFQNIPLSYITGRQRFMGIDFISDKRALIPRKETEILGKKALEISIELAKEKQRLNIIDVCCGNGNLGLSIAYHNPKAEVYSTDISHEAIDLTRENISLLKLDKQARAGQGDMFSSVNLTQYSQNTDIIVCNPPYISIANLKKLNPEISQNEPMQAFDGGMFGIKILQRLLIEAPIFLNKNGFLVFEVGVGQGEFIIQLCQRSSRFTHVEPVFDQAGNIRVISASK
jgi:release factor glutamine methyltransferase